MLDFISNTLLTYLKFHLNYEKGEQKMQCKLFKKNIIIIFIFSYSLTSFLSHTHTFLVFGGKTGWVGQKLVKFLQDKGHNPLCAAARLENREEIIKEIEATKPDFIINAAGITGRPNVDWCEDHQPETLRVNVIGTLNLADIAHTYNIHLTNISTGCIYQYDEKHPLGSGKGFTEEDEPNFAESFYSRTKILLEKLISTYPNVLHLRLRMPISADLNPRGFIGKVINYKKLVNIPNSMAVVDELLPLVIEMAEQHLQGIYNFVNPGTISHNEIMDLYKQYINPQHTYENFSVEEQAKILKAGRSNCELDATKLLNHFPTIPHIKESIIHVFERMQQNLKNK